VPGGRLASRLYKLSVVAGSFRWAFMPVALFALIAVGVHAAADTVDDRLLWLIDRLDELADRLLGAWSVTQSWVDAVGAEERTSIARGIMLVWEIAADVVLALPAFGYQEQLSAAPVPGGLSSRPWFALLRRALREPSTLRLSRLFASASMVVAGACAVAKMIQGAIYLSARPLVKSPMAASVGRGLAIAVAIGILATVGWRAVLRNLQAADQRSKGARGPRDALLQGLVGAAITVPLAVAALADASPVLSFFR